jgi:hypothetical protein
VKDGAVPAGPREKWRALEHPPLSCCSGFTQFRPVSRPAGVDNVVSRAVGLVVLVPTLTPALGFGGPLLEGASARLPESLLLELAAPVAGVLEEPQMGEDGGASPPIGPHDGPMCSSARAKARARAVGLSAVRIAHQLVHRLGAVVVLTDRRGFQAEQVAGRLAGRGAGILPRNPSWGSTREARRAGGQREPRKRRTSSLRGSSSSISKGGLGSSDSRTPGRSDVVSNHRCERIFHAS